MKAKINQTI